MYKIYYRSHERECGGDIIRVILHKYVVNKKDFPPTTIYAIDDNGKVIIDNRTEREKKRWE